MNHTCAMIYGLIVDSFKDATRLSILVQNLCGAVGKNQMKLKEHRNVLAGFAFVNFISPLVAWQTFFEIPKNSTHMA